MRTRTLKAAAVRGGAQKLEALLVQWDSAQGALALARAEQAKYEALGRASGAKRAPTVRAGCCGCLRPRIDAVEHFNRQVCCLLASARVTKWLCLCGWCAHRAHWLLWLPARNARVRSSYLDNFERVRVRACLRFLVQRLPAPIMRAGVSGQDVHSLIVFLIH